MAKFSMARHPYYIVVAVYMGFVAVTALGLNTTSSGTLSDVYLGVLIGVTFLACMSVFYLLRLDHNQDDDVDTEVAGLPFGKSQYYIGVLAIAGWRAVTGYQINHSETGLDSVWGLIWVLSSVAVVIFTYANYRSYTAAHPVAASAPR